jgi:hypothetical protein
MTTSSTRKLASVVALGLLAPAGLAATMALTPPAAGGIHQPNRPVSHSSDRGPQRQLAHESPRKFWTPERMAKAKSLEAVPVPARPDTRAATPRASATPKFVKPTSGSRPFGGFTTEATGFPRPYKSFLERTNVKIFFTQNGGEYVCSGTVVNSPTKNMVNTAGHCLADGFGDWSENVLVVPAFSSKCDGCGDAPYGTWAGKDWMTTTEWFDYGNFLEDYGYIIVKRHRNGVHKLVGKVGGRGVVWDLDTDQTFTAMGYPAQRPFDGYSQEKVSGETQLLDDAGGPGQAAVGMLSDLNGGSSGGAWDVLWNGDTYVNGHNDYTYGDGYMYSPYYGDDEHELYQYAVDNG